MENYTITVSKDKKVHHYEVGEYMHHVDDKCKFRVFENGAYVASLHPMIMIFCTSVRTPARSMKSCSIFLPIK